MSRSIHTTYAKNIRGLTKREMYEQYLDPNSDLALLAKKSSIKSHKIKSRKNGNDKFESIVFSISEVEELKNNMLSNDSLLVKEASNVLGQIGGRETVEFLISLLDSKSPYLRQRAALALYDIKDNIAVRPLINAALKNENNGIDNSTLVFALQSMDCSQELISIFKILLYGIYSEKLEAYSLLVEKKFTYSKTDVIVIREMWWDCNKHPEKCPEFANVKDDIQELVDQYSNDLSEDS